MAASRSSVYAAVAAVALLVVAATSCSSSGKSTVEVPNVLGKTEAAATQIVAADHLVLRVKVAPGIGRPEIVVAQSPGAGTRLMKNGTVTISVSQGRRAGSAKRHGLVTRAVANLGPCPKVYPNGPSAKLNAGIKGLNKKLVPIAALSVRICEYGGVPQRLEYFGREGSGTAKGFEDETNGLATARSENVTCDQMPGAAFKVVTFASDSQQVTITERVCVGITNGVLFAHPTTHWTDLATLILRSPR